MKKRLKDCIKNWIEDIKFIIHELTPATVSLIVLMFVYYIASDVIMYIFSDSEKSKRIAHILTAIGVLLSFISLVLFVKAFSKKRDLLYKQSKDELSFKIASIISSNIDHQLRSPLVAIRQSFEDIRADINEIIKLASPGGKRDLDKIIYGCSNVGTSECKTCPFNKSCTYHNGPLVKDILDNTDQILEALTNMENTLKILEANRKNKDMSFDNLYALIKAAIMTYVMIHKSNIKFEISEEFKHFRINSAYTPDIVNIFQNHISNSIDAKAFFIEFKFLRYDEENEIVEMAIIDDGNGIPPHILPHIWEYKISSKGSGRGFGMFFCKQILKSIGGDEEIVSTSQDGTIIKLKIPAKRIKDEQ